MSLWSRIKKAVKKAWRVVKAVVRTIVRVVITIVNRLTFGLFDLLFGFFNWPRKRLRLHVFIVSVRASNPDGGESLVPVVSEQDVDTAVQNTKRIYKELFTHVTQPLSSIVIP